MKNSRAAKKSAAAHHLRLGKDPYFDWTVILAAFIAMSILCVSFAFALWKAVSTDSFVSAETSSNASTATSHALNMQGLQKIITVQTEKASAAAQYEKGYPGPADPSL